MDADDPLLTRAMEPDSLIRFLAELEAAGFERTEENHWVGPTHPALIEAGFTASEVMTVVIVAAWPYRPPLLHIPDLDAWHADRELLCIWEEEDNTQRWTTVAAMNARIVDWVAAASDGFTGTETARNPEIYWRGRAAGVGLIDIEGLIGNAGTDGQHGDFHFVRLAEASEAAEVDVLDIRPGGFSPVRPGRAAIDNHRDFRARWYYRDVVDRPPRDVDELRSLLTDKQRERLDKDLRACNVVMFGLIWPNAAGLVCSMVLALRKVDNDERTYSVVLLRPKGRGEMMLRAGPDAADLQHKHVGLIGAGAIGSHLADALTRAGVGRISLYDHDRLWPANLIRHATAANTLPGVAKTHAISEQLGRREWATVDGPPEGHSGTVWDPREIADLTQSIDLLIDATGHAGFSELAGRVAHAERCPFVSVALLRGGSVARVRRQAHPDDTPILARPHLDRYPEIPPLPDELEYVGTETGCLSRVHNAPPPSVASAGTTAAHVAIDTLMDRYDYDDEIIDVLRGGGDRPFSRVGRLRRGDLDVVIDIAESALHAIIDASQAAAPLETGGALIGTTISERTVVVAAIELPDTAATDENFTIAEGRVAEAVESARHDDPRLGYVGEWHSHPNGGGVSTTDRATMMTIAADTDVDAPILVIASPNDPTWNIEAIMASPDTTRSITFELCGDIGPTDVKDGDD